MLNKIPKNPHKGHKHMMVKTGHFNKPFCAICLIEVEYSHGQRSIIDAGWRPPRPTSCDNHENFADECMACHDTCNEGIDWPSFDLGQQRLLDQGYTKPE